MKRFNIDIWFGLPTLPHADIARRMHFHTEEILRPRDVDISNCPQSALRQCWLSLSGRYRLQGLRSVRSDFATRRFPLLFDPRRATLGAAGAGSAAAGQLLTAMHR
jgi:hypothetical protein